MKDNDSNASNNGIINQNKSNNLTTNKVILDSIQKTTAINSTSINNNLTTTVASNNSTNLSNANNTIIVNQDCPSCNKLKL